MKSIPQDKDSIGEFLTYLEVRQTILRSLNVCPACEGKGSREYRIYDATGRYPLYFDGVCQECGGTGARKERAA